MKKIQELQNMFAFLKIEICWSDGHLSQFKPDFFEKYGWAGKSGDYVGHQRNVPWLWKSDYDISKHDYTQTTQSKEALLNFLRGTYEFDLQ